MTTDISRRDLTFLFSSLAAVQQKQLPTLSSKVYTNDEILYKGDGAKKGREFFNGLTHSGFHGEVHETILGPNMETVRRQIPSCPEINDFRLCSRGRYIPL